MSRNLISVIKITPKQHTCSLRFPGHSSSYKVYYTRMGPAREVLVAFATLAESRLSARAKSKMTTSGCCAGVVVVYVGIIFYDRATIFLFISLLTYLLPLSCSSFSVSVCFVRDLLSSEKHTHTHTRESQ